MPAPTLQELAKMIDHSLLQPTLTDDDDQGCLLALEYDVASVCIKALRSSMAKVVNRLEALL